jgi:hypothetical protein
VESNDAFLVMILEEHHDDLSLFERTAERIAEKFVD